ncbi:MurR/RpiR family transcriptional regulator [Agrobacterium sp. Ap1]|jgi:DNA-binding MurR/RpiR family transcriptional regulator|uniref:MurR/RpiR family transcriptional regulator n=1 Tax=Agrobacterium sp. Ap1 TaxID=2815337 RepID=UPI001A8EF139|nr:MurR/RpiR family transcriptional regulator [Agrobacterium sp. Ap1]MBO0145058.1 MurR/RpiR family transcriptional regulator [Agrobacterium sp. Ap1]
MDKQDTPLALSDLISRHSTRLTDADTRLLDVLIQDPIRAALENGKDVSSRAGVHPASAVRLARRLGFKGYPEFRGFLQSSLTEGGGDFESPAARMAARLVKAESDGLLASVLDSEIAALQQARNSVSDADIRAFSTSLRDSRRIFVFGRGHFAALSSLIALRLNRSGYEAVDLSSQMHQLTEMLSTLSAQDVVWLLAFRRAPPLMQEVRDIAAQRGAKTLAVTDVGGTRIDPAPDHQILVSRGDPGESQSLVVPMTIANAVILDLASIDDGRSIKSLNEFKAFRASSRLAVG